MNVVEGSDGLIVPEKRLNKGKGQPAESAEGRGPAKGNAFEPTTFRTQRRGSVSSGLERVREAARRDRRARMTALLHHVGIEELHQAYTALNPRAAAGVDGTTWEEYGKGLPGHLEDLHDRLHGGRYRAQPSKRIYLPKPDGRKRPIGIAALEDKLVQHAVGKVLEQIYETDFVGISYGFRPGRGQHDALDALYVGLTERRIAWVLDADIESFFDRLDHAHLMGMLGERIGDQRILRLIRKWLRAGVMEEGRWKATERGVPQGAVISPLLANIYLHHVFDQWTMDWRRQQARQDMIVVRYADDIIIGFANREEAEAYRTALDDRLKSFGLNLHPTKTRLLPFGPRDYGDDKPGTFSFLGFTHQVSRTRAGRFTIRRQPDKQRQRRTLSRIKEALYLACHVPIPATGQWLSRVLRGYFQYFGVPGTRHTLDAFRTAVLRHWLKALRRRSQKYRMSWARFAPLIVRWLPKARIVHPYPSIRFYAKYLRQEPCALGAHARICAGGAR